MYNKNATQQLGKYIRIFFVALKGRLYQQRDPLDFRVE